jgi:hypothetical protein
VAVQNLRVQMQTSTLEAFRHWCELLSPVLLDASSDRYACLPQAGTAFENGSCYLVDQAGRSEVACGKLSCTYVCQCEAAGCSVASGPNIPGDIQLDAALSADGSSLTGTMVLPGEVRTTVRLTRQ